MSLLAGSFGSNLLGSLFGIGSERKRRRRAREEGLQNLQPLESLLGQRQFGPTESEGNLMQVATNRTLSQLASQGVLNSSISAPAVAAAVAPIENQRQQRTQGLLERVVAARQAILSGTELPGYGAAFGQAFGEGGDLLALLAGMQHQPRSGSGIQTTGFAQGPDRGRMLDEDTDPLFDVFG